MTKEEKMETFDFGYGPVPAHKHPNGGGWVADTAKVDPSAYVGSSACVFDNARVYGSACVYGSDKISRQTEIVFVSGFNFLITVTPQSIMIGCQHKSHSEFLAVTKQMAIKMGLPAAEYSAVKAIVKAAVKQVTRK